MEYLSKVSVALDVGSRNNQATAIDMFRRMQRGLHPLPPPAGKADETIAEIKEGLGIEVEADRDGSLWIHEADGCSTSNLVTFVLACSRRFDLKGLWSAEICHDASEPVMDGYGGGFVVLDLSARTVVRTGSTHDEVSKTIAGYKALSSDGVDWIKKAADDALQAAHLQNPDLSDEQYADLRLALASALADARQETLGG